MAESLEGKVIDYTAKDGPNKQLKIGKPISGGSFGELYVASDESGEEKVVKFIATDCRDNPRLVEKFKKEIASMSEFDHPNIVKFYGKGCVQDDGSERPFYVMEKWGKSLRDRLAGGQKFTLQQIVQILSQAAAGLKYAHDKSTLHRDLHAGNILLDENLETKLADFGMMLENPTVWKMSLPTMAPSLEVATRHFNECAAPELREKGIDTASIYSDVFSLGKLGVDLLSPPRPPPAIDGLLLEHIQGVLSKACNIFAKWRGNAEDFMQAIISEDYKKQQETQQTAPLKADLPIAQQQGSQAVAPSVPPTRELVKEQYDQGFAEGFAKGKKEGRAAGIQEGEKAAKKQMKRGKWTIGEALGLAIPASVIVAAGLGILGGIFIGKAAHDDTSHHAVAADYADAADGGVDDSSAALPLDASKEKEDGDADRLEGRVDSAVDVADAQIERYVTKLFCRGDKIHFGRDVLRPEDRDSPYFHVYPASDDPEGRRAHHFWIEPGDCFKPGRNLLPDAEIEELLRIIREREEAIRRGDYSVMSDRERRREFAWTISCFPDDEIVLSSGLLDEENLTSTGTWRGRSFLHRAEPLHRGGPGGGYVIISPGRCFDPVTAGETDGGSPDAGSDADVTDSGSRVIGRAPIYTLPPPTGTTYRLVDPQSSRPRPRSR